MRVVALICSLLYILTTGCSHVNNITEGGSGTRTGNPAVVTGYVYDLSGGPAKNAAVTVRRNDFLPDLNIATTVSRDKFNTITDENGRYLIDSLDTGSYAIEVNDQKSNAVLIRCVVKGTDSLIRLGNYTMNPYATIQGSFSKDFLTRPLYVKIYGLERMVEVDTAGNFMFSDIPAGNYTICMVNSDSNVSLKQVDSISVFHGQVFNLSFPEWKFTKKLFLNTTSSGAYVNETVHNFPVLVRLNNANFDFSGANVSGSDLRFSKYNGKTLHYEIENWDSGAKQAAIWVNVDTVFGNNDSQYITMHWGKVNAEGISESAEVFSGTNGFSGVYHLHGNKCNDASSFVRDGTVFGTIDTTGIIGQAQLFKGNEYIEIPGLMGTPGSVTLSSWVFLDESDFGGSEVISIGDHALIRMDDTIANLGTQGSYNFDTVYNQAGAIHDKVYSGNFFRNTGWHHIAYVIDGSRGIQSLYIDGEIVNSKNNPIPINYLGLGRNTYIGRHGNKARIWDFIGRIDETRVCSVVRTSGWLKLCYMNQKQKNALVEFR